MSNKKQSENPAAKILQKIKLADEKINAISGVSSNNLIHFYNYLINNKNVEVGYRSQCGATHITQKIFREWVKIVKLIRLQMPVIELINKHKNSYATNNNGFWNSITYSI